MVLHAKHLSQYLTHNRPSLLEGALLITAIDTENIELMLSDLEHRGDVTPNFPHLCWTRPFL